LACIEDLGAEATTEAEYDAAAALAGIVERNAARIETPITDN
jgi:hypothetical protein